MDWIKDLVTIIATIFGIVASLYGFWKWVRPKVAPYFQGLAQLPNILAMVGPEGHYEAMARSLLAIRLEVIPDHGENLRSIVERTERGIAILGGVVRAHYDADGTYARFETDGIGTYTWVNKTYLRWVERSLHEIEGYAWINSIGMADRVRVRDEWESAVAERREFNSRFHMRDSRGREFLVECTAVPVPENGDLVERWVGIIKRVSPSAAAKGGPDGR